MSAIRRNSGFSLIEMAVVLVITGLILGTVIGAMNVQMTGQRIKQTQERQQVIKDALVNFVRQNSRLPCPADIDLDDTHANAGAADCSNAVPIHTNAGYMGAVPWKALGLSAEAARDAYGKRFTYAVTGPATDPAVTNATTLPALSGNLAFYATAADASANANPLNACQGALTACDNLGVAAVISHGTNGYGAYTSNGSSLPLTRASAEETENTDANLRFVIADYNQQNFDDMVTWIRPSELLISLIATGAIRDYRGLNNARFEQALIRLAASSVRKECSPGSGIFDGFELAALATTQTDAWGNPVQLGANPPATAFPHTFCAGQGIDIVFTSTGFDAANPGDELSRTVSSDEFLSYAIKLH